MEELGSYQTDFHEILYFKNFQKSSEEIQVSLKFGRIKGTLHENQYIFFISSRSFLLRMRNFSDKICRENQNTHFMFSNFFFENRAVYEKKWKKFVEQGRAGHRRHYGACALHARYLKLQIHTRRLFNNHCFSTTIMVTRTRLSVTLFIHFLSCCFYYARYFRLRTYRIST